MAAEAKIDYESSQIHVNFTCACGVSGEVIGQRAASIVCGACNALWELGTVLSLKRGAGDREAAAVPVRALVAKPQAPVEPAPEEVQEPEPEPVVEAPPPEPDPVIVAAELEGAVIVTATPLKSPGAEISDRMRLMNMTANELDKALHVKNGRMGKIIAGEWKITPDLAERLGLFFGNDGAYWTQLQSSWDLLDERKDPKIDKVQPAGSQ